METVENEVPVEFWSVGESESLQHEDIDDAIEDYLDKVLDESLVDEDYHLVMLGYARCSVEYDPKHYAPEILTCMLDSLDDEYGDPDQPYDPSEKMIQAAQEFVKVVLSEYTPWACKVVEEREVHVASWVREHCPEWLEERKNDTTPQENSDG